MAARKGQAPKRQAQAADPAPVAAAENAPPPEPAVQAGGAPDPVVATVGSDVAAAAQDPAPSAPIEEAADTDDLGRFPVLSPLRFDGRRYRPDDPDANEVVMPRDQAEALIAIDVLGEELT